MTLRPWIRGLRGEARRGWIAVWEMPGWVAPRQCSANGRIYPLVHGAGGVACTIGDMGDRPPSSGRRRSEVVGALGAVTEWYDFGLYIYLAPVYGRIFFPGAGPTEQLLASFAVFAIAYLARPIGAIAFGRIGDRDGRKSSLTLSALIMAGAMLVNGILPTDATIGVTAAALLLGVRMVAGFAVGGEYSGILVYLLETATDRNRGLVASWAPAVAGVGTLLAVGISAAVTSALSQSQLDSWGWRIPVLLGAALASAIYLLRRQLTETATFEALRDQQKVSTAPLRDVLASARRALLVAFGLSAVGSASYYLNVTYVPTFLTSFADVDAAEALRWSTVATAAMLVTTPLFGLVADRIGRRASLYGLAGLLAAATPLLFAGLDGATALVAVALASGLAIIAGGWSAVCASTIPEQFRSPVRFSGIAVGYNAAVAIFGGLTPPRRHRAGRDRLARGHGHRDRERRHGSLRRPDPVHHRDRPTPPAIARFEGSGLRRGTAPR